jgi:hypothetical protein
MELASCQPSGAWNFKVACRFLEDMCPASGFPFVMHLLYTLYYSIYDVMFRVGHWSSVLSVAWNPGSNLNYHGTTVQ